MLSLPEEWDYTVKGLVSRVGNGQMIHCKDPIS